jgi:hypothetical protein
MREREKEDAWETVLHRYLSFLSFVIFTQGKEKGKKNRKNPSVFIIRIQNTVFPSPLPSPKSRNASLKPQVANFT